MVVANHLHKTLWQHLYSLLGFWVSTSGETRTLYWMFLPWGPFYRKIDLFSWCVPIRMQPVLEETINPRMSAEHEFTATGLEP